MAHVYHFVRELRATSMAEGSAENPQRVAFAYDELVRMKGNSGNAAKGRFRALDGLRGAAALLVVVYHIAFYRVQWPNHLFDNDFVRHGYLAVDLFFILSGLVISSNYSLRLNNLSEVKEFLLLRFFRLYPLHHSFWGLGAPRAR